MFFAEFFVFQAEDGIRVKLVTGVQTCALQIYELEHRDEAIELQLLEPGVFVRGWCWLVGFGSVISVSLARRV